MPDAEDVGHGGEMERRRRNRTPSCRLVTGHASHHTRGAYYDSDIFLHGFAKSSFCALRKHLTAVTAHISAAHGYTVAPG